MSWEDELKEILVEYDFERDTPGTWDFGEAEKPMIDFISSLLKKQRENILDKAKNDERFGQQSLYALSNILDYDSTEPE